MRTPTILAAWECGAGYGHLMTLKPFIDGFLARGCRVVLATKDLLSARQVFPDSRISLLPIPTSQKAPAHGLPEPCTFADILCNVGCADLELCLATVSAWRTILELVQPDLMLCEYSPFSLLALRTFPNQTIGTKRVRTLNLGTGFYCPPNISPLPDWRPWLKTDPAILLRREQEVLAVCQQVVRSFSSNTEVIERTSPLEKVTDLFTQVDQTLLLTYRELDPFQSREPTVYGGYSSPHGNHSPAWPSAAQPRVFAYLRNFPGLPGILDHLSRSDGSLMVYAPDLPENFKLEFKRTNIVFIDAMVNLKSVLEDSDLVINYGSHGTVCASLLAAKPIFLVPTDLEKRLTALAVTKLGAGLFVDSRQMGHFAENYEKLVSEKRFQMFASEFANRYRNQNQQHYIENSIEALWNAMK